ncbi:inositol polyphosphate multikinase [Xylariaceae sp. FL1272]|nr:inositol polyphosphate multikinase [Xylariaceae sp. FL1272]
MSAARDLKRVRTAPLKPREVPRQEDLVDYNYAVAGHDGTMCDADGELFVKPCTQSEVDFYESAKQHPDFADLMPVYCGDLALLDTSTAATIHAQLPDLIQHSDIPTSLKKELQSHLHVDKVQTPVVVDGKVDGTADSVQWIPNKNKRIKTNRAIALLNQSYGFKKPNIMDAKLGYRLWADDAPEKKKERFDQITAETTHKNFGFRVAGMQVYKGSTVESELNEEGFRIYDKDWGRFAVNDENLVESCRKYIFNEAAGIDEELGKLVAGLFATDLQRVQEVLENEESRMYSSSLLFVFEGDGKALRAAIDELKSDGAERQRVAAEATAPAGKRTTTIRNVGANSRVDSGIDMGEDELKLVAETVPRHVLDELDDEEEEDDESEMSVFPHIYTLKLIDFAHADWTPGQGPDENVLKGVRSLVKIFEQLSA